jgi:hypothetical protein
MTVTSFHLHDANGSGDMQFAFRFVLIVTACVAFVGCSSESTSPLNTSMSGQYIMDWSRSAATCAPNPLPVPQGGDTSAYARVSAAPLKFSLSMDAIDADSTITLSPKVLTPSALRLQGTFGSSRVSATFRRNGAQTEGLRAGGHTFFVTEEATDSAIFVALVQMPPATQLFVSFAAKGFGTATFRDNGPAGAVYTTCVFAETINGARSTP